MHVEEGSFGIDDLRAAREAFLASTVREVQAVSSLDGRPYPPSPAPAPGRPWRAFAGVLERQLGS